MVGSTALSGTYGKEEISDMIDVPRISISFPVSIIPELIEAVNQHRASAHEELREKRHLARILVLDGVPSECEERINNQINAMTSAELNIKKALEDNRGGN